MINSYFISPLSTPVQLSPAPQPTTFSGQSQAAVWGLKTKSSGHSPITSSPIQTEQKYYISFKVGWIRLNWPAIHCL